MTENPFATAPDDTVLTAQEVHQFLRLERTAGYVETKKLKAAGLECAPERFRLGDLRELQRRRAEQAMRRLLAGSEPAEPELAVPSRPVRRAASVPLAV